MLRIKNNDDVMINRRYGDQRDWTQFLLNEN